MTTVEELMKLPPQEFPKRLDELEVRVKEKTEKDEIERKASLIVSFFGSVLLTVLMTLVISLVSY